MVRLFAAGARPSPAASADPPRRRQWMGPAHAAGDVHAAVTQQHCMHKPIHRMCCEDACVRAEARI
eukprot:1160765-Pelagomonas_calceolata.AAC.2